MRILHTSDWHLGRTLEGKSRLPEQAQFIEEICDIARRERADIVLLAGDVYDSYNPPAEAEEMFFDALERLADGGERAVVVIAGNHDSPDRLHAANPLASRHGISLLGYPLELLATGGSGGRASRVSTGPGWIEVGLRGLGETAVVYAIPYPSESRLNEVLSEALGEAAEREAYSGRVARLFADACSAFRADAVNLLVAHLFVSGGWESDSERQIQLGGAMAVNPVALPAAHYVALGHLHRPQAVNLPGAPCMYSGSPLAYSFSEADRQKEVVIVDAGPRRQASVTPVPLSCGKPLKRWRAGNLAEVQAWCSDPRNLESWVDLEVESLQPLSASQVSELRRVHPGIVNVRVILPETAVRDEGQRLSELTLAEQFDRFVTRERGAAPERELLDLFLELASDDGAAGEAPGGEAP
ncbi:MAG: exonuclease SbcCD subunit D [Firmicutes bacterium]|nr:exonuclease SbcCD subunit D [Bacillota bacterium]